MLPPSLRGRPRPRPHGNLRNCPHDYSMTMTALQPAPKLPIHKYSQFPAPPGGGFLVREQLRGVVRAVVVAQLGERRDVGVGEEAQMRQPDVVVVVQHHGDAQVRLIVVVDKARHAARALAVQAEGVADVLIGEPCVGSVTRFN
eukprot:1003230-Pyramimonas_sp.AAC.2